MNSSTPVRPRWLGIALAAALLAVAVPTASASLDPSMPPSSGGLPPRVLHALPPEDQAAVSGGASIGGYAPSHRPALGADAPADAAASAGSRSVGAGFDWADAGIGAGGTAALILLAGGAAAAVRRPGRSLPATD